MKRKLIFLTTYKSYLQILNMYGCLGQSYENALGRLLIKKYVTNDGTHLFITYANNNKNDI